MSINAGYFAPGILVGFRAGKVGLQLSVHFVSVNPGQALALPRPYHCSDWDETLLALAWWQPALIIATIYNTRVICISI